MDRFSFLGSVHAEFIDEQYQRYLKEPDSTEPSWRAFFQGYDFAREVYSEDDLQGAGVPEEVIKEFHVLNLIQGYRSRGHLFTKTNPVRERREYRPTLDIENFGLSKDDLDTEFNAATELGASGPRTLRKIVEHLEAIYCQSTGVEYNYIRDPQRRTWIKHWIHENDNQPVLSIEEKKQILHKLNQAVSFEAFLNTKFVGQKRFSIEGAESLIPGLDEAVNHGARHGVQEFVLGMAHRGRLNVLTNIFAKPPTAPAQFVISPPRPKADPDGQENPRGQRPRTHPTRPRRVDTTFDQSGHRKRERHREAHIAEVEERRVERQTGVLKQRVEVLTVEGGYLKPQKRVRGKDDKGIERDRNRRLNRQHPRLERVGKVAAKPARTGAE